MLSRSTFLVGAVLVALPALAQEPMPPPPLAPSAAEVSDPALERAAEEHRQTASDVQVPGRFQDALRDEHHSDALEAIAMGRTPALACIEALLREQTFQDVYVPEGMRVNPLQERVLESVARTLIDALEPLRLSYAQCLATIADSGPFVDMHEGLMRRAVELETLRASLVGPQSVFAVFPAMRAAVNNDDLVVTWEAMETLYFEAHGTVRESPQDKRMIAWRTTPYIVNLTTLVGSLAFMAISPRSRDTNHARHRLAALGLAFGSIGGIVLAPTWTKPQSGSTLGRLIVGALLTVGSIAGGAALAFGDFTRRFRLMGAGMLATGIGDAMWLLGGTVLYRRSRPLPHGRPTVTISRHEGSLGWTGSF